MQRNFCRQCGAARKGTAAAAPSLPKGASFVEVTAEAAAPNSSLHLQVLIEIGGRWLWANGLVAIVLLGFKNLKFDYPAGWAWAELCMLLTFLLLLCLQRWSGCYANRAQSAISMACFLALSGVLLLLVSYFAGHKYSKRTGDSVLVYLAAAVAFAALVTAWVVDLVAGALSAEQMYAAMVAGLTLLLVSVLSSMICACRTISEF
eukprot:g21088.t1